MSPDDLDRLRRVEIQLVELVVPITASLKHLETLVSRHNDAIFGQPDNTNSLGIDKRIDRLEQVRVFHHWLSGLTLGACLPFVGTALIRIFIP
jgi:hypothetical protein